MAALLLLPLTLSASPSAPAQTANEKAANGLIPGEVSLYASELACTQKLPTSAIIRR